MKKSEKIEELIQQIGEKKVELEELDNWESDENDYDSYIDDSFGDVDVMGISYSMSQVLKGVDKIRYNMGKSEWEDEEREKKKEEIQNEISDLEYDLEELEEEDE